MTQKKNVILEQRLELVMEHGVWENRTREYLQMKQSNRIINA